MLRINVLFSMTVSPQVEVPVPSGSFGMPLTSFGPLLWADILSVVQPESPPRMHVPMIFSNSLRCSLGLSDAADREKRVRLAVNSGSWSYCTLTSNMSGIPEDCEMFKEAYRTYLHEKRTTSWRNSRNARNNLPSGTIYRPC